jgi:hypothetical protein
MPQLEKFFRTLAQVEFSRTCFGIVVKRPVIAVHFVGYSRLLHLGEKFALKDCILRWGSRGAIVCNWPTPYTDSQIREILGGDVFKKEPDQSIRPTAPSGRGSS